MKKSIILLILVLSSCIAFTETRDLSAVQRERDKTAAELAELRMYYIKKDPALLKLHRQIMELHKNLALSLDSRSDIRKLHDKLIMLDAELKDLKPKAR